MGDVRRDVMFELLIAAIVIRYLILPAILYSVVGLQAVWELFRFRPRRK